LKENEIIYNCKIGDSTAQRMLFDQYYKYVFTICHRYLQNHHDAEDVVSVVFIRIFKNISNLKDSENRGLKRWIQTISINESLRFLKKREPIDYTAEYKLLDTKVEPKTLGSEIFYRSEIKKVINEMPQGYRTIFLMNVVEGLSHSEIAKHLDISRNTSKSQMLKARKYLQTKLRKDESRRYG
jgi:RNA polymerase sigma-70 factor (ECF subfamily)